MRIVMKNPAVLLHARHMHQKIKIVTVFEIKIQDGN